MNFQNAFVTFCFKLRYFKILIYLRFIIFYRHCCNFNTMYFTDFSPMNNVAYFEFLIKYCLCTVHIVLILFTRDSAKFIRIKILALKMIYWNRCEPRKKKENINITVMTLYYYSIHVDSTRPLVSTLDIKINTLTMIMVVEVRPSSHSVLEQCNGVGCRKLI